MDCISTTFRFLGANDKVCVETFDDPQIPGVFCHISQARTGGIKGRTNTNQSNTTLC